ncbi:hypothetical protein [Radiobacillus deserti]|uniref:Uncharacterized protein n=1 Tax=Radiobacillus deserti TaxID=2594883 RepID=A0A516KE68_9BACI|nr:hypothetical protein [Radiobacillus deserti]QDP39689.1 hypothetical protein FN924_05570 [Radiobacillus deserti]
MEFNFGNITIFSPSLSITIIGGIILFLLYRWSKELETGRGKVFFYFLISSSWVAPVYYQSTESGVFQLWAPLGFIIIFLYLFRSEKYHPAKMKASLLGLLVAFYQIILQYIG